VAPRRGDRGARSATRLDAVATAYVRFASATRALSLMWAPARGDYPDLQTARNAGFAPASVTNWDAPAGRANAFRRHLFVV
jgi:hypothetical protein